MSEAVREAGCDGPDGTVYTHHAQLRWGDIDQLGHVNNVVFVDLLQQARAVWWLDTAQVADLLGPRAEADGPVGTVVAELEVEWLRPLWFGQEVQVHLGTTGVGAARFTIWYEITVDGEPVCRARSLMCVVSLVSGRIHRLPTEVRAYLASVATEPAPLRPLTRHAPVTTGGWEFDAHVRWSDLDAYGHVNNAQYFELFQEARVAMLADLPGHWMTVVGRADIRYRQQVPFRLEPYRIHTAIARVGASSVDQVSVVLADAADPSSVMAELWCALVVVDRDGRPRRVTDAERELLLAGRSDR